MVEQKDTEIYELICDECGKKIVSLSENQAFHNMKIHKITHETKEVKKDEN